MRQWLGFLSLTAAIASCVSDTSGSGTTQGNEGGSCYANGTCNGDLLCDKGTCKKAAPVDAGSDTVACPKPSTPIYAGALLCDEQKPPVATCATRAQPCCFRPGQTLKCDLACGVGADTNAKALRCMHKDHCQANQKCAASGLTVGVGGSSCPAALLVDYSACVEATAVMPAQAVVLCNKDADCTTGSCFPLSVQFTPNLSVSKMTFSGGYCR